ncbi:phage DNA packaging protein C, partial [Listeria monocytogenes]
MALSWRSWGSSYLATLRHHLTVRSQTRAWEEESFFFLM